MVKERGRSDEKRRNGFVFFWEHIFSGLANPLVLRGGNMLSSRENNLSLVVFLQKREEGPRIAFFSERRWLDD